ncbi:cardiolipin synthase [Flexistipes sp.]|uniref:cardiolipin synthase n=1 Tax=Flexistipes sp. TaxID=3088135 RepID=UPI002E1EE594|nr:cardiolipin synthase [Flexistipes sp.]
MNVLRLFAEYFSLILSIALVLVVLSGRKEARATFSWVLIIIFFPYLGALLYLIFGNPRLKKLVDVKLKSRRNIRVKKYFDKMPEYKNSRLANLVETVTNLKPQLCYDLELLPSATDKYSKLARDLLNARHYILIEYYVFRQDETGDFFLKLIEYKAEQGVKVFFLYDGMGAVGITLKNYLKNLKRNGGKCAAFLSPLNYKSILRMNFRNHRKIVVVDGRVCYTGGINIGNEYIGDIIGSTKWVDTHVRFSGDAVYAVEEVFSEDWYFATGEDITDLLHKKHTRVGGDINLHVIPSGPDQSSPLIYDTIFSTLSAAEKTIDIITPYLVPDQPIIQTLKNASKRGVKVRILLPGKNNHPFVAAAGRSYYEELVEAGVDIYETRNVMLHAKIIMIDGFWTTLGSANMDARSFRLNFELNVVIYSKRFASNTTDLIDSYFEMASQIELSTLQNKKFINRIFEGVCRTLSPVL